MGLPVASEISPPMQRQAIEKPLFNIEASINNTSVYKIDLKVQKNLLRKEIQAKPNTTSKIKKIKKATRLLSMEEMELRKASISQSVKKFRAKSGRNMKRGPEPPRNKVHWDYLLDEMKWMANDFKKEHKWKKTLARKVG